MNASTGYLKGSTAPHLKPFLIEKKLTTYSNSAQGMLFGLYSSFRLTKVKTILVCIVTR
jgi:hypothetical protein